MQVNSQLLDTVQHKARLGEQLDEMEVNIVSQIQARRIKTQEKTFMALKGYQSFTYDQVFSFPAYPTVKGSFKVDT